MKKNIAKWNVIVFSVFLAVVVLLNAITPDQSFSDNENRFLQEQPKWSLERFFGGKFTSEFETYITDQFVGRDFFVGLKAGLERLSGKLENNDVYFSTSDFLLQRYHDLDVANIEKNQDAIVTFMNRMEIPTKFMLIPSSVQVVDEKPFIAYDLDQAELLASFEALLGERFIDVLPALSIDATSKYFKTDHHFNIYGAQTAYQVFSNSTEAYQFETLSDSFHGTLYSKSGMYWNVADEIVSAQLKRPIQVTFADDDKVYDSLYFEENLTVKDQYKYYLNGNHALVTIETNQPEKPDLLVIRDSFGNIMSPFFVEDYDTIYLYDLRYNLGKVDKFLQDHNVDEILLLYSVTGFVDDRYLPKLN
ncbi:MAG: DHHW family protein [Erysipelotrichaceae bacterium]